MAIDPNFIEVNEITDYWTFLRSVSRGVGGKINNDYNELFVYLFR